MESSTLPETLPLVKPGYSLELDMLFGWVPKSLKSNGPVPIKYWNNEFPACQGASKTVYYGFCPKDTYSMHQLFKARDPAYTYDFSNPLASAYEFLSRKINKTGSPRPFVGMAADSPDDCLHFDSYFESGNLDKVVMVKADEYDLYLRPDANTGSHFQWFYFTVSNVNHLRQVRFNLVNLSRRHSLYDSGKRPYCSKKNDSEWKPVGKNVVYGPSKLNRVVGGLRRYYCLSFDFKFGDPNEVYCFAELPPYSFTKQIAFLKGLESSSCEGTTVRVETLCRSLSGLEVPLVTITDERFPSVTKQSLLIVGRVHPGEVVASYIMEGILRFLCSADPDAIVLRQRLEVRLVPMLNPDGVVIGNSRTSLSGCDLNRRYLNPDPQAHVEVWALKDLISVQRDRLFAFVDVHGHSTKKGAFLYGPQFALHNDQFHLARVVPKLMSEQTEMFRFFSCKFRVSKLKHRAARAVVAKEFAVPYSYTFEASFHCYLNEMRQTIMLTLQDYMQLGKLLAKTLSEFDILLEIDRLRLESRSNIRMLKRGLRVERPPDRTLRPKLKQVVLQGSHIKLRTIPEIVRQIKAEDPTLDLDSSGSDSDSSDEDEGKHDLNFIHEALSELNEVVKIKSKPTSIRVVDLNSSKIESKCNLDIRLPTLLSTDESYEFIRPFSNQLTRHCSTKSKLRQERTLTRHVAPSQTVTYPLATEDTLTSTSCYTNLRTVKRHKNSLTKLKRILRKMEPRTSLNASIQASKPRTPVNLSFNVLRTPYNQVQGSNPTHAKSQIIPRKTLKRNKSASIYSKFGPFSAPLEFE